MVETIFYKTICSNEQTIHTYLISQRLSPGTHLKACYGLNGICNNDQLHYHYMPTIGRISDVQYIGQWEEPPSNEYAQVSKSIMFLLA